MRLTFFGQKVDKSILIFAVEIVGNGAADNVSVHQDHVEIALSRKANGEIHHGERLALAGKRTGDHHHIARHDAGTQDRGSSESICA